jgi:hypothetical protein
MLGFEFTIAKSPYTLLLREEKLRGSQGFREIWDADDPLNQLSKRRREARCGWINQDEQVSSVVIIYLFSNEISRYFGVHIHFKFGLGRTIVVASLVKLKFSILQFLGEVFSLGKICATIHVMRH